MCLTDGETLDTVHSFGGYEDAFMEVYQRKWPVARREELLQMLEEYELPDFDAFEHSKEGTEQLYEHLTEGDNSPDWMRFVFGCIVYHQMLYVDESELGGWYIEEEEEYQEDEQQ
jgi:hypothetical protein